MKKFLSALMMAAVLCGAAAGCKDSEEKSETVIRMVTEATFPPYESFAGDKIVGIDPDVVGSITKKLGYKLEIIDMKFDSVILAVQTGKAEIAASGITVTEERKKQVNFTIPYVTASQVIIVPANSDIKTKADLKDKRIGVQQGTTGDLYVTQNYDKAPERFENGALAAAALRAGKLDAVVLDGEPAKVHVSEHAKELKILPEILTEEFYAFAIAKDNVKLLNEFNKCLAEMIQSGELQQILDKHLNK